MSWSGHVFTIFLVIEYFSLFIKHNFTPKELEGIQHNTIQISYNEIYVSVEKTTANKTPIIHHNFIHINMNNSFVQRSGPLSSVTNTF